MDKNIAALLREDTKTVLVQFHVSNWAKQVARGNSNRHPELQMTGPSSDKAYTYVTDLDLAIGDQVVVHASDILKVATVVQVDTSVNIKPNSDIQYKWVLAKIDLSASQANDARNERISQVVSEAYKVDLRRSFAQQILSGVEPEQQLLLSELLK